MFWLFFQNSTSFVDANDTFFLSAVCADNFVSVFFTFGITGYFVYFLNFPLLEGFLCQYFFYWLRKLILRNFHFLFFLSGSSSCLSGS